MKIVAQEQPRESVSEPGLLKCEGVDNIGAPPGVPLRYAGGFGVLLCALAAGALAGCSTTDPDTIDRDFGSSVRRMVEVQKYTPYSQTRPAPMDGLKAEEVYEAYRKDVARPREVKQPVQINIGTGT